MGTVCWWRFRFFLFFFLFLGDVSKKRVLSQSPSIQVNVGVVLDMKRDFGKMGLKSISLALSDFYRTHNYFKTRIVLHNRDAKESVVGAAAAAVDLLKNVGVHAIIGPVSSMQANFVINLGDIAQVPIISFSATSPSLSSLRSEFFFQATLNDAIQVKAIAALVQSFGWKAAVPIYIDNDFGEAIIPGLINELQSVDTKVPYRSVIHPLASDDEILRELYKLMTMQTRVFIVHLSSSLGIRLLSQAKEIGMMTEGYVWITTDGITAPLSLLNSSTMINSMEGLLGVKPHIPQSRRLKKFIDTWKSEFQRETPFDVSNVDLSIFGLWAYDAATALAMAVEKVATSNFRFDKNNNTSGSTTDLDTIPVSQMGKELQKSLSTIGFRGLTGDIKFGNRQLQSSAYEIINVIDSKEKVIGFWKPETGITKTLSMPSPLELKLDIRWPGDASEVPKGWQFPTNGKKLRIGVPEKEGISDFVSVSRDSRTNTTTFTGFSIDVFKAVVARLPYALPYDFIPFVNPDGRPAGTYNDLVHQVAIGKFDAVVGDVTITANRSIEVDFTLPYTESGVTMIVPVKDKKSKTAWVFLRPWTWDLWFTTACFFIFIGFVIWILEYNNEDFHGNPAKELTMSQQLGTSLWFSLSTLYFAHREKVKTGLARFVVIIWCFVVLILTQSYTASLTSMLTISRLEPTVTSIRELKEKGEIIGYSATSFVHGLLREQFPESQLKPFESRDDLDKAFTNQSGRIAAAFDEIPYMKLFLAKYCSKYTMVAPAFKTDGFGFVFPKGSPFTSYFSRAILAVTQGPEMEQIENKWFGGKTSCPSPSNTSPSNKLGIDSFWGLFLVIAVASLLALIVHFLNPTPRVHPEPQPNLELV